MDEELENAIEKSSTSSLVMALVESVTQRMAIEGFERRPGTHEFIRRRNGITDRFSFTVKVTRVDDYRIQPSVGVRIERVEEIYHRTSQFHEGTVTMGAPVGYLIGKNASKDVRDCEFVLASEPQIVLVAEQLMHIFRTVAIPYFQRWSSIAAIDAELNDHPERPTVHRGMGNSRCSTGIIVAKLVGRRNYDQLADYYLKVMTKNNKGFYFKWFLPLLESLKTIKPESSSGG